MYKEVMELRSNDKDTIKIKLSPYFCETNELNISIWEKITNVITIIPTDLVFTTKEFEITLSLLISSLASLASIGLNKLESIEINGLELLIVKIAKENDATSWFERNWVEIKKAKFKKLVCKIFIEYAEKVYPKNLKLFFLTLEKIIFFNDR